VRVIPDVKAASKSQITLTPALSRNTGRGRTSPKQGILLFLLILFTAAPALAAGPTTVPAGFVDPSLIGRRVEEVRITGNAQVPSQTIRNQISTTEGSKFDPATVEADYQNIYKLKRFSDVEAKVEPTAAGVIVIFDVTEEKLIKSLRFVGNRAIDSDDLHKVVELKVGEAIEPFQISLARKAIVNQYLEKNFPFCHVDVDDAALTRTGDLILRVTEGPHVTIRNVRFIGATTYSDFTLNPEISTTRWYWIFNPGTYRPEEVDRDVAALRRYYQEHGFFDVRVGRKLIFSPDQTELEIDFLIDEGVRYKVDRVTFTGNVKVPEGVLRNDLQMVPGRYFDADRVRLDIKQIVKAYSPLGYIYGPRGRDPDYLRIGKPEYPFGAKVVYHKEPGTVELVYEISEGKPFRVGRFVVVGNNGTKQNVILRQYADVQPGTLYNSAALADDTDRVRSLPNFKTVTMTPIGGQPGVRDVLVEVEDNQTAKVSVGGQVNSNLGLGANLSFVQQNFDLFNPPARWADFFSDRAFAGAGETFAASFQPGLQTTNADVSFSTPYIFDQPYSFGSEAFLQQYSQREWGGDERHAGGSLTFGKQFDKTWSAAVTFKAEDVTIGDIYNYYPIYRREDVLNPVTRQPVINAQTGQVETQLRSPRAPDVLEDAGHSTVTDIGLVVRRATTNSGPLLFQGTNTRLEYKEFGALGGEYHYHQFDLGFDDYNTLYTDLQDRRTVLGFHADGGYILGDAPFFNRFYGGGRGSIRGFEFRGVGPRAGRDLDPIGGNLELLGSVELNFPVYGDSFRGVVFTDFGTIEPTIRIHDYRQSVGAGVRVVIPVISKVPFAFDVAFPIFQGTNDIKQVFSFGLGIDR
jgi:outer membrane protein insertion porin family